MAKSRTPDEQPTTQLQNLQKEFDQFKHAANKKIDTLQKKEFFLESKCRLLSSIINSSDEVTIVSLDRKYCYTAFNTKHSVEMKKVWNADIEIGKNILEYVKDPFLKKFLKQSIERALSEEKFTEEMFVQSINRTFEIFWCPVIINDKVQGVTAYVRNITQQKLALAKILQLSRLYATLSQINQAIIRIKSVEELFLVVTKIAVEFGENKFAWIGELDETTGLLSKKACFGETKSGPIPETININIAPYKYSTVRTSIEKATTTICSTLCIDPEQKSEVDLIVQMGFQSVASVPIKMGNATIGILNLYSDDPTFYRDDDEIKLLDEIGLDISYALDKMESDRLKQQWADAFEHCSHGIAIGLPDSNTILTCNPAFSKLQGRNIDEIRSMPILSMYAPENHDLIINKIEFADKNGSVSYEANMVRKDGSKYPVQMDIVSVHASNGKVLYRVATQQDITMRKLAEIRQKESETKFSKIYTDGPFGIALVTADYKFLMANNRFCEMLGYTEAELHNLTFNQITFQDDRTHDLKNVRQLINGKIPIYKTEKRYVRKDGQIIWGSLTVTANYSTEGEFEYNFAIIEDISSRKATEEALQKASERLSLATRAARIGIWDWNILTDELIWDDQMYNLYGIQPHQFPGAYEAWLNGVHPDDQEHSNEVSRQAVRNERDYDTEFRVLWPDGSIHWLKADGQVFQDKEGKPFRMVGINYEITTNKEILNNLKSSEAKYRAFFDFSYDAILITSMEGDIRAANPAACALFGYSEKELTETGLTGIIHTSNQIAQKLTFTNEIDQQAFGELTFTRKNGEARLCEVSSAIFQSGDNTLLTSMIIRDITEKKQAENKLIASEERYRSALDNMMEGCQIIATDWTYLYINKSAEIHNRIPREQMIGKKYFEVWPGIEETEVFSRIEQTIKHRVPNHMENRFIFPGNEVGWFDLSIQPIPEGAFILSIDITERINGEIELRKQSERLKHIHEIDHAMLKSIDSTESIAKSVLKHIKEILQCKEAYAGFFVHETKKMNYFSAEPDGGDPENPKFSLSQEEYGDLEALGKGNIDIVEDIHKADLPDIVYKVMIQTGIQSFITMPLFSTEAFYGTINIGWEEPKTFTPEDIEIVEEVSNQISLVIEQTYLLENSRLYASELETRVKERTRQLEETNHDLESFSYSVSHDLRAPLRHIGGYVDLLNEKYKEQLPDKAQHYLTTITDATKRMGILIDDLLQFSRTGRKELQKVDFEMNTLVQDVLEFLKPDYENRIIHWNISDLPSITGDYSLLRQVWVNLMSNAVKFTRTRDIAEIKINYEKLEHEFVFSIADNGSGFDMKYAHKLFGVFQRLHSVSEFEGTGISLANVRRIILKHEGRTWAESQPDQGATFYFTLPA